MEKERVNLKEFFIEKKKFRFSFFFSQRELNKTHEQLEASLQERTLDFEEMKRRLVKAVRYEYLYLFFISNLFFISEKAELFNSIHAYEMKLEEQQSKKWIADEDVLNCTKCNTLFGWTVRKVYYLIF